MAEKKKGTLVLGHDRIQTIIERLAHQILENHAESKELILIGISGRGIDLRDRISDILAGIGKVKLQKGEIQLNKLEPLKMDILMDLELSALKDKEIVLIDDVLNSGKTLVHCMAHLLKADVKSIRTVVLVDRIHRNFPIKADYVGMSLSTTIQERVEVELGKEDYAYLV